MHSTDKEPSTAAEFMDDFYSECDEYLIQIRRSILNLRDSSTEAGLNQEALERLFRSFHSLKGIFGMAGFQAAEELAHKTEDYLRGLSRNELTLTNEGFDALSCVANRIETIVAAHRQGEAAPDGSKLLEELGALSHASIAAPEFRPTLAPDTAAKIQQARQEGLSVWRCVFSPSVELNQQGININSVRARLEALGSIIHSAPVIEGEHNIRFEFYVASHAPAADFEALASHGTVASLLEPSASLTQSTLTPEARGARPRDYSPIIRVELSRLDELMRIMGELVLYRARIEDIGARLAPNVPVGDARALQELSVGFGKELRNLRDGLMRTRMVSIREIFERLPFVVGDLARESGKRIRVETRGQDTEIDKYLVERLKEPLLHLVRNAVAHGIESPEDRAASGKPEEALISLSAATDGDSVVIEVADDGRGMDFASIVARARSGGLAIDEEPDAQAILDTITTPGFSTREMADRSAGRGMGMDAVKNTLTELGGTLALFTDPGHGAKFTLRLPLTLAVADALILSAGGQKFAMPQSGVQEITLAQASAVKRMEHSELIVYRDRVLPLIRLSHLFGLKGESRPEFPVLVIGSGQNAVGIVADRVLGQREIVVRSVHDPLLKVPAVSGATELGDGRAVLILNSNELVAHGLKSFRGHAQPSPQPQPTRDR